MCQFESFNDANRTTKGGNALTGPSWLECALGVTSMLLVRTLATKVAVRRHVVVVRRLPQGRSSRWQGAPSEEEEDDGDERRQQGR